LIYQKILWNLSKDYRTKKTTNFANKQLDLPKTLHNLPKYYRIYQKKLHNLPKDYRIYQKNYIISQKIIGYTKKTTESIPKRLSDHS